MSRIVRADVTLPENITNEYPEASRCTRAMLRQQPDRRPSAMSLLNRPRLQPPTYDLPGMQQESTRDTKLFDPSARESRDHRELGSRPRHIGEPVPAKALSPRTNVKTRVANHVLDFESKDEKYGFHQYVTHKGIIDESAMRTGTPRPTYPASPLRTGSREARSGSSFGQPLSARPKARAACCTMFFFHLFSLRQVVKWQVYQAQQPVQRLGFGLCHVDG